METLPLKAEEKQHTLKHNDLVVMGSDGVFDNLYEHMIVDECVKPHLRPNGSLTDL